MDRDAILRSVNNGIRHLVYDDPGGTRFLDGRIVHCGATTTIVQDMDGEEFMIQNDLIVRIEPFIPKRERLR